MTVEVVSRSALPSRMALRVVVPLVVLAAIVVVGYLAITALLHAAATALPRLFLALLPLFMLLLILRFAMTGRVAVSRSRSRDRSRRGTSIVGGLARAGSRSIGGALGGTARAGSGITDGSTEVHQFRIDTVSAGRIDCELVGELYGPALRQGDWVTVTGRLTRRHVLRARRVRLHGTGGIITARAPLGYHLARAGTIASLVLLIAVAAAVAALLPR